MKIGLLALVVLVAVPVFVLGALRWIPPPITAFMLRDQTVAWLARDRGYSLDYRWTPMRAISAQAAIAVIAAEDQKFPIHSGFDVEAIHDALETRERGGRLRGASTISQQVAKNLFLWPGRSFVRKALEGYLTVLLELLWPKRRILEVYLNTAEMGRGIYGVGAASRRFFSKTPSELTAHEAALLAAVLPSPRRFRADAPSGYVRGRARWIQDQMEQLGGAACLRGM